MKNSRLSDGTLSLNKGIYTYKSLQTAIIAFDSLADIDVSEDEDYYHLIFRQCKTDTAMLLNEFGNYVLVASIKNMGDLYD